MKMLALVVGPLVLVSAALAAQGEDEKVPSIKEVMKKLHAGQRSPLAKLKGQLSADSPQWDEIEKTSKDFVILGAALAKNTPPRGEKAGWKKLSDRYFDDAKALDDAAKAHDKAAASAAQKRLGASCKACHTAHKGKAQ